VASGPVGSADITEGDDTLSATGTVTGVGIVPQTGGGGPDEEYEAELHQEKRKKFIAKQVAKPVEKVLAPAKEKVAAKPIEPIAAEKPAAKPKLAAVAPTLDIDRVADALAQAQTELQAARAAKIQRTHLRHTRLKALLLLAAAA
jgi:hypothetical protein